MCVKRRKETTGTGGDPAVHSAACRWAAAPPPASFSSGQPGARPEAAGEHGGDMPRALASLAAEERPVLTRPPHPDRGLGPPAADLQHVRGLERAASGSPELDRAGRDPRCSTGHQGPSRAGPDGAPQGCTEPVPGSTRRGPAPRPVRAESRCHRSRNNPGSGLLGGRRSPRRGQRSPGEAAPPPAAPPGSGGRERQERPRGAGCGVRGAGRGLDRAEPRPFSAGTHR